MIYRTLFAIAVLATATLAPAQAATYAIDATHSSVTFKVTHLGISTVSGTFATFEGTVDLDPKTMAIAGATAKIDASSIDTGVDKRDGHLRSADFFHVDEFPHIQFTSTGVTKNGDQLVLAGDLTLHGVTKRVNLTAHVGGAATDPYGNERVAITASTTINRKDFGLGWNQVLETGGLLVSEKVEIELEVSAVKQ